LAFVTISIRLDLMTRNSFLQIILCFVLTVAAPLSHAAPDFGDGSSSTLATKAWKALEAGNWADVVAYCNQCITSFEKEALITEAKLKETPAPAGESDEAIAMRWALNDVGTCYFILGQALQKQGKDDEAKKAFNKVIESLPNAQCWDTQGWYWKPADAAKEQLYDLELKAK